MHLVYPLPPTMFFITIVSSFFSPFNTVAPREIEDNDYGTFWGVNKILYALGKIFNSFYIYAQDFHPAGGGLCEW